MTTATIDLEKVRRNALKAIREGRVTVRSVGYDGGPRSVSAAAQVRGYTGVHQVTYLSDQWRCTCGTAGCPHVFAAQLVTGHAGSTTAGTPEPPTSGSEECRHGMTTDFCADCTGRDGGEAALAQEHADLLSQRGWTRAAYPGRCAQCGEPYARQDPIRAMAKADQGPGTVWAGGCCREAFGA